MSPEPGISEGVGGTGGSTFDPSSLPQAVADTRQPKSAAHESNSLIFMSSLF